MNDIRPGLRLINGTADVAKVELRLEAGEEIEVPEGSVIEQERGPLSVAEKRPVKAPAAKKAPVK